MKNNKKILIVGLITLLVMVGVIGGAFAYFIFANTGESQVLVAGDVFMKYTESDTIIDADMMMPRNSYDPETYFEFTIEGKNTHNQDLYYEILINEGDPHETRKTRLDDKFLRFRLEEIVGDVVTPVIEEGTYEEIDNTKIWVNTIKANTKTKTSIKYRLYMWITDEVNIGVLADADYSQEVWNNDVFASIKVSVNGDFEEKKVTSDIGTDVIKSTIGQAGGIIGIKEDAIGNVTKETIDTGDLREYRYSGLDVNNYVYFNCTDSMPQNADNCEKWRIVGVFKDENDEEHLKIVRNETLAKEMFPATYFKNGTEYNIGYTGPDARAYWNNKTSGTSNNDWAIAGLQYWLNDGNDKETKNSSDGYMSYLSKTAKSMIEETKYYLGIVTDYGLSVNAGYDNLYGIKDTTNEAYKNERAVTECEGGKGPNENNSQSAVEGNSSCRVWSNNSATWKGNVALLYSSDYGYSADSQYWNTIKLGSGTFYTTMRNNSWLLRYPVNNSEWLLTASSYNFGNTNIITDVGMYSLQVDKFVNYVKPTLYLKSSTKIVDGDGTEKNAYQLELGQ